MIDLHAHILYGFDDGAQTLADSLAMARMAAQDGIQIIVATPHSPGSVACLRYAPDVIVHQVAELNAALQTEKIPLEVVAGTEIAYAADIVERLQRGALLTYGGSQTILLELPYTSTVPPTLGTAVFNLQVAGYRVVLAHPERSPEVQRNPNVLLPLIERGVLLQITGEALTGGQGSRIQRAAEMLLTKKMAHIIASDTHGLPPHRPPLLSPARERAIQLVGPTAANALLSENPAAILHNKPLRMR